jgi:hypothetical protein
MDTISNKDAREETCKRKRIKHKGENWYFTICDKSMTASFPNESSYELKDMKALLNFSCRLMSKIMCGKKISWSDIADQAEKSGIGHKVITDDIARIIRETHEENEPNKKANRGTSSLH